MGRISHACKFVFILPSDYLWFAMARLGIRWPAGRWQGVERCVRRIPVVLASVTFFNSVECHCSLRGHNVDILGQAGIIKACHALTN